MLTRAMKIQLLLFATVSTLIVGYTAVNYAGFGGASGCRISVDLADSGGIFTGGEVDYRGVQIGQVGPLTPTPHGVRAALDLHSCVRPRIPRDVRATVSDLSVIGEQYVELQADSSGGPYLRAGEVIPQSRTTLPVPTQVLLANIDGLTRSIDPSKLSTVITELGVAFDGQSANLRALLEAGDTILDQAQANLPATIELIKTSEPALSTLAGITGSFASWARSLRLLTAQLRADDPTLRSLIGNAPAAIDTVLGFAHTVQAPLATLFGNLITGGTLLAAHLGGIEQLLVMYPRLVADGSRAVAGGRLRLGVVIDWGEAEPCVYPDTTIRQLPEAVTAGAPNLDAHCSPGPIRGAERAPSGNAALSAARVRIDTTAAQSARLLGDKSWLALLTEPLAQSRSGS